jgi:WD40 repeat protein
MANSVIFTTGGTVQASGGIYIERRADEQLLRLCREAAFAYILYTRQVGKSSLMVHAAERLAAEGVRSVIIDLNEIGTEVSLEGWYLGLLDKIEERLSLNTDIFAWWEEHAHLGITQRLTLFFEEVLLKEIAQPVVIFVDEIDTTLSLNFSADDFFAAIRSLYNARAYVPEFRRLSFVLSGVATPSDLIQDPQRTPFNIGQRVELTDFTYEEALPLAQGLGNGEVQAILKRILDWTGGHPYLTQKLCRAIAEANRDRWSEADVDQLVCNMFLGAESKPDDNLQFVRDMMTKRIPSSVDVSDVLTTYREVRRNRRAVPDEERSLVKSHLKLSAGVVRRENGALRVRNAIYREVFDDEWVKEHLPVNWQKLLRRAVIYLIATLLILSAPLGIYAWIQRNAAMTALDKEKNLRTAARMSEERARTQAKIAKTSAEEAKRQAKIAKANEQKAKGQSERAEKAFRREQKEKRKAEEAAKRARDAERQALKSVREESIAKQKAEKAAEGERIAKRKAEKAAEEARRATLAEKGSRAALLAQQSGKEIDALIVAVESVGPSLKNGQSPAPPALEGLASAVAAVRYSLPLRAHEMSVNSAAFSPDSARLVTASDDGTARIWDARTGQPLVILKEPDHERAPGGTRPGGSSVYSAAFSPDSARIVTGSDDGIARIWDARTGKSLATLEESRSRPGKVYAVSFSRDGARLVTASYDGAARIWDARNGKRLRLLQPSDAKGPAAPMTCADFSPNGQLVVTASWDATARVWNAQTGELLHVLSHRPAVKAASLPRSSQGARLITVMDVDQSPPSSVNAAAFSPDGARIVTASNDRTAWLWNAVTGEPMGTLRGHSGGVTSAAFSRDGGRLITASEDGTARVWDARNGTPIGVLRGHIGRVNSAAFSPDGMRIVTAGDDRTARLWGLREDSSLIALRGHTRQLSSVVFSSDDTRIVTADDQTIRLWNARSGASLVAFQSNVGNVRAAFISADSARIVTTSDGGPAELWNVSSPQKPIATLRHDIATAPEDDPGYRGAVRTAAFSPDGKRVVTGSSNDKSARIWDARTGAPLKTLEGHENGVELVAFSPDGARLVTITAQTASRRYGQYRALRLWDARTGEAVKKIEIVSDVPVFTFSPDGAHIVVADRTGWLSSPSQGERGATQIWNARSGEPVVTLRGQTEPVTSAAFSPDGTRLVTGGDKTARVWNVRTGKPLQTFAGHSAGINSVAFSRDGKSVITASLDQTARLWDVSSGRLIGLLREQREDAPFLFIPNGERVVWVNKDGSVNIIPIAAITTEASFKQAANVLRYQPEWNKPEFKQIREYCQPYLKPDASR